MVNYRDETLDTLFSALSDSTRRAMLKRLANGEMSVMDLAEPFDISKPAVTKHLKVLEKAGLLKRRVDGRIHHCRLVAEPLTDVAQWITFYEQFWNKKFDALDAYLKKENGKKQRQGKK